MQKKQIRLKQLELTKKLSKKIIGQKSSKIINNLINLDLFKRSKNICIYVSKDQEVKTHDLIKAILIEDFKNVLVPFVSENNEIKLSKIKLFSDLLIGKFNILEPREKITYQKNVDLIIIPGVAFDEKGNRLGRGRGYYDQFLSENKIVSKIKIALAFEEQVIDKIPSELHDIKMDFIITENKIIECNQKNKVKQNGKY
jgi:5-formyltetrahydrofolate cyclo-ligase